MKKYFLYTAALLITLSLVSSCKKATTIKVRVSNKAPESVNHVIVGYDNYGNIRSGETTDYLIVPEGNGLISGMGASSADSLTGTYSFTGSASGTHDYTINIISTTNSDGSTTLTASVAQ